MTRHLKVFLPAGLCLLLITLSSSSCKNSAPVKEGDFMINNKELIFKKAEEGDSYHQGVLAGMYLDEMYYMYIKSDKNEAYKWAKKSSDNNHPFGLYNLAEMYNNGAVVGKDEIKAKELYLEAYPGLNDLAESGDQIAQYYLSNLLISGKGVIQNTDEGSKWLQKAAEQGNAAAQFHLGISFAFKLFDKPELEKYNQGMEWLHKAADQGLPVAQFMLAEFYMKPAADGVSPNYNEAIKWYRKLADNGDVDTQLKLADIYFNGEGVQKDHAEAVKWLQKAADQGNSEAQHKLGYMYEKGQGVQRSFDEAAKWYQKAADQGNAEAKSKIEELKKESESNNPLVRETYEETRENVLGLTDAYLKDQENRLKKAEEIRKMEDYYANLPNLIHIPNLSGTISTLCERYYKEVQLGGETKRCLERFIKIVKQKQPNVR